MAAYESYRQDLAKLQSDNSAPNNSLKAEADYLLNQFTGRDGMWTSRHANDDSAELEWKINGQRGQQTDRNENYLEEQGEFPYAPQINRRSQEIVKVNHCPPIHERLEEELKRRVRRMKALHASVEKERKENTEKVMEQNRLPRKLEPKKSIKKIDRSKSRENLDHHYKDGMRWIEEKSQKNVERQTKMLDKEIDGASFEPTINKNNTYYQKINGNFHKRQEIYAKNKAEKIERLETSLHSQHTYKPSVNKKSNQLAQHQKLKDEIIKNAKLLREKHGLDEFGENVDFLGFDLEESIWRAPLSSRGQSSANMLENSVVTKPEELTSSRYRKVIGLRFEEYMAQTNAGLKRRPEEGSVSSREHIKAYSKQIDQFLKRTVDLGDSRRSLEPYNDRKKTKSKSKSKTYIRPVSKDSNSRSNRKSKSRRRVTKSPSATNFVSYATATKSSRGKVSEFNTGIKQSNNTKDRYPISKLSSTKPQKTSRSKELLYRTTPQKPVKLKEKSRQPSSNSIESHPKQRPAHQNDGSSTSRSKITFDEISSNNIVGLAEDRKSYRYGYLGEKNRSKERLVKFENDDRKYSFDSRSIAENNNSVRRAIDAVEFNKENSGVKTRGLRIGL